ncbi:hypothetical protein [Alkalimonas sp.]|uniref:hypothetical protein n=1 Tax=Alkalimonas sp. TaxID=1872453 RepID=UPI00263B7D8C|nr:hypothetical protein [Alkalimonas sp.]MCC5825695.1 hypothetical protein [Alkalimonas sp.]
MKFNKYILSMTILTAVGSTPAIANIINFDISTDASVHFHGEIADWDSNSGTTDSQAIAEIMNLYETPTSATARSEGNDTGKFFLQGDALHNGAWFGVESSLVQNLIFQNQTGMDQSYHFNFTIEQGMLALFGALLPEDNPHPSHSVEASYQATILVNGQSIWTSQAWLHSTADGLSLTTEGTVLAATLEQTLLDDSWLAQAYRWDAQSFQLNLGQLAAGESFELSYQVSAYVGGRPASASCQDWQCGGYYYFGDPFTFAGAMLNESNFRTANQEPTPVTAPATFGSMVLGLLALTRLRRRRQ